MNRDRGRLLVDMTGQFQWYAHYRHASGIQRVTEHILRSGPIRSLPNVEFVFRPLGARDYYTVDPSITRHFAETRRKATAISSLRWLLVRATRVPALADLLTEARVFDAGYILRGLLRLDATARRLGKVERQLLDLAPPLVPTAADTLVNTGDFWCHPRYARTLVDLKRRTGVRIVLVLHDLFYLDSPEWNHPKFDDFARQLADLAPHVDAWMPTSRFVESQLRSFLERQGLQHATVCRLPMGWGLGPDDARPASSEVEQVLRRFGLEPQGYFLAVGKAEPRRNLDGLLDAYRSVQGNSSTPLPRCVIVGQDGWRSRAFRKKVQRLRRAGLDIAWLKNVSDAELSALYAAARLCVVPSKIEGWGLPIRESLSLGTPCLASDAGGAREAGAEHAEYFDSLEPAGLASALSLWLLDDEKPRRARAALEPILQGLGGDTWNSAGQALIEAAFPAMQRYGEAGPDR